MNILIVDKHILFRDGLASMLSGQAGFTIVGEAGTVRDAVEKTVKLEPDAVLMNIALPDGNGLDAIKDILYKRPDTKVVILTDEGEEDYFLTAVKNGAKGFLPKNIPVTELIKSLRALERDQVAISRKMTHHLVDELQRVGKVHNLEDFELEVLTSREVEVLKYLGDGSSNREIASQLSISPNTVRVHVNNILKKLNLNNRREVYHFVRRQDFNGSL
jgi:DNA-binding NarL/FixJ family response regulator